MPTTTIPCPREACAAEGGELAVILDEHPAERGWPDFEDIPACCTVADVGVCSRGCDLTTDEWARAEEDAERAARDFRPSEVSK